MNTVVLFDGLPQLRNSILSGFAGGEVVFASLPEDVAQAVLRNPQVHGVQDIDHHHGQREEWSGKERGWLQTLLCLEDEELPVGVPSFAPNGLEVNLLVVLVTLVRLASPTNVLRCPTGKGEQLCVPRPVTSRLPQKPVEAQRSFPVAS